MFFHKHKVFILLTKWKRLTAVCWHDPQEFSSWCPGEMESLLAVCRGGNVCLHCHHAGLSGGTASPMVTPCYVASALELLQCPCCPGQPGVCTSCSWKPVTGAEIGEQRVNDRGADGALQTSCKHLVVAASSYFWNELELLWL